MISIRISVRTSIKVSIDIIIRVSILELNSGIVCCSH